MTFECFLPICTGTRKSLFLSMYRDGQKLHLFFSNFVSWAAWRCLLVVIHNRRSQLAQVKRIIHLCDNNYCEQ